MTKPFRREWGTPETHPWIVRFICCGREDGTESFKTWEEADAFRVDYCRDASGHVRQGIIERRAPCAPSALRAPPSERGENERTGDARQASRENATRGEQREETRDGGMLAREGSTPFPGATLAAPEAPRGEARAGVEYVRVAKDIPAWSGGDSIQVGTVLRVVKWLSPERVVVSRNGGTVLLIGPEWETYGVARPAASDAGLGGVNG